MSTLQSYLIVATVAGQNLDAFETFTGGEVSAEPTKRRSAGGQLKQYAVRPDYSDVTITRVYERERDHELYRRLLLLAGNGNGTVQLQPLIDGTDTPWGKPITYSGMLMTVTGGDADVTATENRMLSLVWQIRSVR